MPNTSPQGKALITGASSGIGAIYADRLARQGYDLILVARRSDHMEQLAVVLRLSTGRQIQTVTADLLAGADLARVEEILRTDIDITMLVNNAGVGATASLLASDVDEMSRMVTLNVTALMRLSYAAVPSFVARGRGTIVNISSIVAIAPEVLNGVYGGTKAFVFAFSRSLLHEFSGRGVRVQVVLPGATETNFWSLAGLPVDHLPNEIVMPAEEMVDAALTALERGEFATIPSLPDIADWEAYERARETLLPKLSLAKAADRFGVSSAVPA